MRYLTILCILLISPTSLANKKAETSKEEASGKLITQDRVVSTFSDNTGGKVAIGLYDSSNLITGQSLSLMLSSKDHWFQTYIGVHRASGGLFEAGLGVSYKFTIAGNRFTGLHLGPGITIGSAQHGTSNNESFRLSLNGIFGAHFTLFERLILSVDGGPNLVFLKGDESFTFRPAGALLGLGIHYLF